MLTDVPKTKTKCLDVRMKIWVLLLVCGLAYASAVRYADDDDDDFDDIDLDKEPSGLGARLKARLQRALDRVKARIEKNKDLTEEFGDRLKDVAKHIATIGKEANRKTLETVRIINRKISDLTRDVLRKITSGKFRRDTDEDDLDDLDDLDIDNEPSGLGERLKARLQRMLERVKVRIEKNKDLADEFGDKVKEISKRIASIGKDVNRRTLETIRVINRTIKDLTKEVLRKIGVGKFRRDTSSELLSIAKKIKAKLMTPDGYHEFKSHILNLKSGHPVLQILQSYVRSADDADLKAILKDLLSGIPDFYKARYATELERLFVQLAEIMKTDEGFDEVYDYFLKLQPTHSVVAKLQMVLQTVDKDTVKEILGELISALEG